MRAVLPGATIGILGGGQLGRMVAMAARPLGYRVHALDPDASCASRFVVERCVTAAFDDVEAATALARECDVVTLEIERVSTLALDAAAQHCAVRPSAAALSIIQDRGLQRAWLASVGAPQGAWRLATSEPMLAEAVAALGGDCFIKSCRGGYDGRGQARTRTAADAHDAWEALGRGACVVEAAVDFEREVSVMVARAPSGETAVFPPAHNHHEQRVLAWSVLPAVLPDEVLTRARQLAVDLAHALSIEGLLAVELFVTHDGTLLVNELAPRPHNSFHATELACATSQFEQHVRAVCGLPLGSTELLRPAAIANLLGDLWSTGAPRLERALGIRGVRLHLYGKRDARPGRKMGHLSAYGDTSADAVARVEAALAAIRG